MSTNVKNSEIRNVGVMAVAYRTATATPTEAMSGASPNIDRDTCYLNNVEGVNTIYYSIGASSVTPGASGNMIPIPAGEDKYLFFDPLVYIPVYVAGNGGYKVGEK